ncbi:MAG: hypothetical protein EA369_05065 [Bradymonadales bacterium]|nr:MAG: hypothetical protein EA369_05065 [Bradymonadales bacterium]
MLLQVLVGCLSGFLLTPSFAESPSELDQEFWELLNSDLSQPDAWARNMKAFIQKIDLSDMPDYRSLPPFEEISSQSFEVSEARRRFYNAFVRFRSEDGQQTAWYIQTRLPQYVDQILEETKKAVCHSSEPAEPFFDGVRGQLPQRPTSRPTNKEPEQISAELMEDFRRIQELNLSGRYKLNTSNGRIAARNELWSKIHEWHKGDDERAIQLAVAITLYGEFRGHWRDAHGYYFMKVVENRRDQNFRDYFEHDYYTETITLRPDRRPISEGWLVGTVAPYALEPNTMTTWHSIEGGRNLMDILTMDLDNFVNRTALNRIASFIGDYWAGNYEMTENYPDINELTSYDSPRHPGVQEESGNMHVLRPLPEIKNSRTGKASSVNPDSFRPGDDKTVREKRQPAKTPRM